MAEIDIQCSNCKTRYTGEMSDCGYPLVRNEVYGAWQNTCQRCGGELVPLLGVLSVAPESDTRFSMPMESASMSESDTGLAAVETPVT